MTERDLLIAVLAELRRLRDDLCGQARQQRADLALLAAIEDRLGGRAFSVRMLLVDVEQDPYTALALAIERAVDLNLPERSRATALGVKLSTMPGIAKDGSCRGSAKYRVADLDA